MCSLLFLVQTTPTCVVSAIVPQQSRLKPGWSGIETPEDHQLCNDQVLEYPSTGNLCSRFFLEAYAVTVSGAGRIFFKAVERLQCLTRVELLLLFVIYSFPLCGKIYCFLPPWFVMSALVSRMEHSTIVEGQRLGTVHIMEGTCSRLRFFFVRNGKITPTCT